VVTTLRSSLSMYVFFFLHTTIWQDMGFGLIIGNCCVTCQQVVVWQWDACCEFLPYNGLSLLPCYNTYLRYVEKIDTIMLYFVTILHLY
jgi:hypothetical protein